MKSTLLLLILGMCFPTLSQTKMFINRHNGSTDSLLLADIKSISFKSGSPPILLTGLDCYFPFNGNAYDLSGNGNDGTVRAGTMLTKDRFGNPNKAYNFSGGISSILVNCLPRPSVTFAAWFRTSMKGTEGNGLYIFDTFGADGPHIVSDGTLVFSLEVGVGNYNQVQSSRSVADSVWHFVAETFDGAVLKYYLDGEEIAAIENSGLIDYDGTGYQNFVIGNHWLFFEGRGFVGDIDDVRLYRRALSKEEISLLFHEM